MVLGFGLTLPSAGTQADPAVEASLRWLEQATTEDERGMHHRLLLGLRHLRDPQLSTVYDAMTHAEPLSLRMHGILGLGELSPGGQVELSRIAAIDHEQERWRVLGIAMDEGLLSPVDSRRVMAWDAEVPGIKLLAAALIVHEADPGELAFLEPLSEEGPLTQRAIASMLLAEIGQDAAQSRLESILREPDLDQESAALAVILETAWQRELQASGPFAAELTRRADLPWTLRTLAVRVAMRFSEGSTTSTRLLEGLVQEAESVPQQVRLAMSALQASPWIEGRMLTPLDAIPVPLIQAMVKASRAVADASDPSEALVELLAMNQNAGSDWVVSYLEDGLAEPWAGAVAMAILEQVQTGSERDWPQQFNRGVKAGTALVKLGDAAAWNRVVARASQPGRQVELHALLMGALSLRPPSTEVTQLLNALPPQLDPLGRDLSIALRAVHGEPLSEAQQKTVGQLVRGGSELDNALRVQLAWRYLQAKGQAPQVVEHLAAIPR